MDRRKTRIRSDVSNDDLLILRHGWYIPLDNKGRPGELVWRISNSEPCVIGMLYGEAK